MKMIRVSLLVIAVVAFVATGYAQDENPNGFPSGPHYNLNIHGKNADFTCPPPEYDPLNPSLQVYGNSIFVPENGEGIEIFMQSGKGARAAAIPSLQAIDWCAAAFDGDAAVIQLPKNDAGYRVYARALAKPTDEPFMTIVPSLYMVQDEFGNDLVFLGTLDGSGFTMPDGTFVRKKGQSKAVDITGMFEWTGEVCYFTPIEGSTPTQVCCIDADGNGVYEDCEAATILADGSLSCPANYGLVAAYCVVYEDAWVFNIADFVEYLWTVQNNGLKLLQVRFYPN